MGTGSCPNTVKFLTIRPALVGYDGYSAHGRE